MYDYFYGQQAELFSFYRVPKVLFTDEKFSNISSDAKLLYGIMLDRMNLSAKNGWVDELGRVYIIFTIEEIKCALGCAEKKAVKLLHELENKCGLIERKRIGLGKPNYIYVKNFVDNSVERQFLNCQKDNSGTVDKTLQELSKPQGNNTDIKDTEYSDTDPTLAMVVMREAAISAFRPEPFYTVELAFQDFTASGERMKQKNLADEVARKCVGSVLTVTKAENKEKSEKPPVLYDLTSLQRDANRVLGFTAQQTLDYTQSLYEKKLVTYPRTDSRYLTSDMEDMLPELIKSLFNIFPVEDVKNVPVHAAQVIDDKKVSDHHAIIPTKETLKFSLEELPKGEQAILRLIATRLFCAVGEPFRYNESVIELSDGNYIFSAKGKTTVQSGWKIFSGKPADKDKESEKQLPSLTVGEGLSVHSADVKEGKTSPPKHFTEDTLLQSMETAGADEMPEDAGRKGLGTPATRAATIEKLVRIGFLERKGDKKTKHLISTHKGTALVTVMPEQIQSPSMTADWEEKLLMIERGEYDSNAFLKEIQDMISALVQTYEKVKGSDVLMAKEVQTVGVCPVCGSSVIERQKGFFCSKRECHFALWKNSRYFESIGKSLTSAVAQKLLSNGEVKLKGCKSAKTGRMYDAIVVMTVTEEGKPQFNMNFENGGNSK